MAPDAKGERRRDLVSACYIFPSSIKTPITMNAMAAIRCSHSAGTYWVRTRAQKHAEQRNNHESEARTDKNCQLRFRTGRHRDDRKLRLVAELREKKSQKGRPENFPVHSGILAEPSCQFIFLRSVLAFRA